MPPPEAPRVTATLSKDNPKRLEVRMQVQLAGTVTVLPDWERLFEDDEFMAKVEAIIDAAPIIPTLYDHLLETD